MNIKNKRTECSAHAQQSQQSQHSLSHCQARSNPRRSRFRDNVRGIVQWPCLKRMRNLSTMISLRLQAHSSRGARELRVSERGPDGAAVMTGACRPIECHVQFKSPQSYQAFGHREVYIEKKWQLCFILMKEDLQKRVIIYSLLCRPKPVWLSSAEHKNTKDYTGNQTILVNFDFHCIVEKNTAICIRIFNFMFHRRWKVMHIWNDTWVSKLLQNWYFGVISLTFIPVE